MNELTALLDRAIPRPLANEPDAGLDQQQRMGLLVFSAGLSQPPAFEIGAEAMERASPPFPARSRQRALEGLALPGQLVFDAGRARGATDDLLYLAAIRQSSHQRGTNLVILRNHGICSLFATAWQHQGLNVILSARSPTCLSWSRPRALSIRLTQVGLKPYLRTKALIAAERRRARRDQYRGHLEDGP